MPTTKAKAAPVATSKAATATAATTAADSKVAAAASKPAPAPAAPVKAAAPKGATVLSMNGHKQYAGLTEAEVLKQSEAEYMSAEQLAFFKEKLVELRGQILHNATDTGEHLRDNEVATDPSDRATQEEEYTLELRTRDRERKLLKKISQSLGRLESGEYGFCDETGEPIGLGRLIARPTATLSLEAQQRRELKQKMFGD